MFKAKLKYNIENWITLQTFTYVTFEDEAWSDKIFEIFEFTRDETRRTLTAVLFEVIT